MNYIRKNFFNLYFILQDFNNFNFLKIKFLFKFTEINQCNIL